MPALCDTVRERTDLDAVRVAAIHALAEIGDPGALSTLLVAVRQGHIVVRLAAIESFAGFSFDHSAREALEEIVNNERSSRLRAAAEQARRGLNGNRDLEENDVD